MDFYIGQEFIDTYPIEAAEWCVARQGCAIADVTPEGSTVNKFRIVSTLASTLEQAKKDKLKELELAFSEYRESSQTSIKSSLGFVVNANVDAFNNVDGLISQLEYGLAETTKEGKLEFMDFTNTLQLLSIDDLKQLKAEIASNGSRAYKVKWHYRQQIQQAKSVGYLNKLHFTFE